jgi:crotonobetainyl-CoA:carnitine CoA-transferase CaiB-like acyl-CoA transferase
LDWPGLIEGEAFRRLGMLQTVVSPNGHSVRTTRSPIRVDGVRRECLDAAPRIGEHTQAVRAEMGL